MTPEQMLLMHLYISIFDDEYDEQIFFNQIEKEMFKSKIEKQTFEYFKKNNVKNEVIFLTNLEIDNINIFNYLCNIIPDEYSSTIDMNLVVKEYLRYYYNDQITSNKNIITRKKLIEKLEELQDVETEETETIDLLLKEEERPLLSGYHNLDSKLGLRRKNTYIIGAGTGKGKSTLALNIATKLSLKGSKGAYFSLEMSKEEVVKNICSSLTSIYNSKFKTQEFSESELELVYKYSNKINEMNLDIIDNIYNYYAIESVVKKNNYDYIVVDYVGLIEHNERDVRIKTSKISRSLKILSKELDCCIIIVAQLNRLAETERPSVAHLAESADLERDASGVMLIDRERGERDAQLIIAKNRFGMCTDIDIHFELEFCRIKEN